MPSSCSKTSPGCCRSPSIARVLGLPDAMSRRWRRPRAGWRLSWPGATRTARIPSCGQGGGHRGDQAAGAAAARHGPRPARPARSRRHQPALGEARPVAPDWGEQDVIDNAKFLFEGGSETTAFLICTASIGCSSCRAERRAATLGRPSRVRAVPRGGAAPLDGRPPPGAAGHDDVELGGVTIAWPASESSRSTPPPTATRCAGSARTELDPDRPRLWGHLAFNVGPRHCAGAHLARMEATEAILGLWRAFPDLARAPGAPMPDPIGFVSRAWRPVPLVRRRRSRRTPCAVECSTVRPGRDPSRADQSRSGGSAMRSQRSLWIRVVPPISIGAEVRVRTRPDSSTVPGAVAGASRSSSGRGSSRRHGDDVSVHLVAATVGDERGERPGPFVVRPTGHVFGCERRPIRPAHHRDHRAVSRVGQQAVGRVAHRVALRAVVGDGHPAPQPPAPDERVAGHARQRSCRHRRVLAQQALVLELGPQIGRDRVAEGRRRCGPAWAGRRARRGSPTPRPDGPAGTGAPRPATGRACRSHTASIRRVAVHDLGRRLGVGVLAPGTGPLARMPGRRTPRR